MKAIGENSTVVNFSHFNVARPLHVEEKVTEKHILPVSLAMDFSYLGGSVTLGRETLE